MISSWAAWILTMLGWAGVSVGVYLLGFHRGYLAGLRDRLEAHPDPWTPPSEAEFLAELIEAERLKPEPPRKYQREK
jgi:hypothetical protein